MRIVSSAMSRAQGVYRRRGVVVTDYSPDRAIPDDAEGCFGGASPHGKVLSSPPARNILAGICSGQPHAERLEIFPTPGSIR